MTEEHPTYESSGVRSIHPTDDPSLASLTAILRGTFPGPGEPGAPLLDFGYYANVVRVRDDLGLAVTTDGVGTKILIAERMRRYDTIGIDCVAMNVNDLVCVGARPVTLVDYVAVQELDAAMMTGLARGLAAGAKMAGVSIPGGEIAQVRELLAKGSGGIGFDLVASAVGLVHPERILVGRDVEEGDVLLGLASSGLHSNGYSLTRRVLLEEAGLSLGDHVDELERTLGDELLEPTVIYVRAALAMLETQGAVKAFLHITGDGLLNLARIEARAGFEIDALPPVPAIFDLIETHGRIPRAEMFRVFNMGVGFCVVVAPDHAEAMTEIAEAHGHACTRLGHAVRDPEKKIEIVPEGLTGVDGAFRPSSDST